MLGVIDHFDYTPAVIGASAQGLAMETYALIGGHQHPAYVPLYMVPYSDDMDFFQRFYNFLAYYYGMRFVKCDLSNFYHFLCLKFCLILIKFCTFSILLQFSQSISCEGFF